MINIKQNKHSIKQILIASLCMVSALTFGGDGNLGQPLLGAPGQYDMVRGELPIQITVMWGIGGDKIVELSLAPGTTMDELYEKVKALPWCPQYQASSISNGNAPWCTSCCVLRCVTIKGEVREISPWADKASINRLQQVLNTHRAALPADPVINIVDDYNIVPPSAMTIGQMLTRNNIDNSATIFVFKNEIAIQAFEAQMVKDRRALDQLNDLADEKCDLCLERTCLACIATGVLLPSCYLCDQLVRGVGSL
jgi:hypothetical protein